MHHHLRTWTVKLLAYLTLCGLVVLGFVGVAHADTGDPTMTDFHSGQIQSRQDSRGEPQITKAIRVRFTD